LNSKLQPEYPKNGLEIKVRRNSLKFSDGCWDIIKDWIGGRSSVEKDIKGN
jgi:hypothetical protein